MAFDPDAYLKQFDTAVATAPAETVPSMGGFDPDAYLQSVETDQPQADFPRRQPEPLPTDFGSNFADAVGENVGQAGYSIAKGAISAPMGIGAMLHMIGEEWRNPRLYEKIAKDAGAGFQVTTGFNPMFLTEQVAKVAGKVLPKAKKSAKQNVLSYLGQAAYEHYKGVQDFVEEQNPSESVVDDPSLLVSGSWWRDNILTAAASMGTALMAGGGSPTLAAIAGSAMEAGPMYEELSKEGDLDAAARALEFGAVVALLEKIGFDRLFKGLPKGKLQNAIHNVVSGATEAGTEWLEGPSGAFLRDLGKEGVTPTELGKRVLESAKQEMNVIGPAFVTGLFGGSIAGGSTQDATTVQPPPLPESDPMMPPPLPEQAIAPEEVQTPVMEEIVAPEPVEQVIEQSDEPVLEDEIATIRESVTVEEPVQATGENVRGIVEGLKTVDVANMSDQDAIAEGAKHSGSEAHMRAYDEVRIEATDEMNRLTDENSAVLEAGEELTPEAQESINRAADIMHTYTEHLHGLLGINLAEDDLSVILSELSKLEEINDREIEEALSRRTETLESRIAEGAKTDRAGEQGTASVRGDAAQEAQAETSVKPTKRVLQKAIKADQAVSTQDAAEHPSLKFKTQAQLRKTYPGASRGDIKGKKGEWTVDSDYSELFRASRTVTSKGGTAQDTLNELAEIRDSIDGFAKELSVVASPEQQTGRTVVRDDRGAIRKDADGKTITVNLIKFAGQFTGFNAEISKDLEEALKMIDDGKIGQMKDKHWTALEMAMDRINEEAGPEFELEGPEEVADTVPPPLPEPEQVKEKATKTRKTFKTQVKKQQISPDAKEATEKALDQFYTPIPNDATKAQIADIVEKDGLETSMARALNDANLTQTQQLGLMRELATILDNQFNAAKKAGNSSLATELLEKYKNMERNYLLKASDIGRALQFLSTTPMHLNPEYWVSTYRELVDAFGEKYGEKGAKKLRKALKKQVAKGKLEPKRAARRASDAVIIEKLDGLAAEARARIAKRSGRTSIGVDPTHLSDLTIIAAAQIAKGGVKFTTWSAEMVEEFGIAIKPHLKKIWDDAGAMVGKERSATDDVDLFEAFSRLDKYVGDFVSSDSQSDLMKYPDAATMAALEAFVTDTKSGVQQELGIPKPSPEHFAVLENWVNEYKEYTQGDLKLEQLKTVPKELLTAIKELNKTIQKLAETGVAFDSEIEAEIARRVQQIKDTPQTFKQRDLVGSLSRYVQSKVPVTTKEAFVAIVYANMLSGHETQMVNVGDTAAHVLANAASLGTQEAALHPKTARKSLSDIFKGWADGYKIGVTESKITWKTGLGGSTLKEALGHGNVFETSDIMSDKDRHILLRGRWNPARIGKYVSRALQSMDVLNRFAGQESFAAAVAWEIARREGLTDINELSTRVQAMLGTDIKSKKEAKDQATKEGLRDDTRTQRIKELRKEGKTKAEANKQADFEGLMDDDKKRRIVELMYEKRTEDFQAEVEQFAAEVTYNNQRGGGAARNVADKLGEIGNYKNEKDPAGELASTAFKVDVVPFTRVVGNVIEKKAAFTPLGYLNLFGTSAMVRRVLGKTALKSSVYEDVKYKNNMVKATVGTAVMGALLKMVTAYMDDDDPFLMITGAGPSNKSRLYQLQETGYRQYSMKVGKWYLPYQDTIFGLGMALIGGYADAVRYKDLGKEDLLQRWAYALSNSPNVLLNMSFLRNLQEFFVKASYEKKGEVEDIPLGVVKKGIGFLTPNMIRQVNRIFDPKVYTSDDIKSALIKDAPIARSKLGKPILNPLGEPIREGYTNLERGFSRFLSVEKEHPVFTPLTKAGVWLLPPPRSKKVVVFGKPRDITPEEYYTWVETAGPRISARLQAEIPGWIAERMPKKELQAKVNKVRKEEQDRAFSYILDAAQLAK